MAIATTAINATTWTKVADSADDPFTLQLIEPGQAEYTNNNADARGIVMRTGELLTRHFVAGDVYMRSIDGDGSVRVLT